MNEHRDASGLLFPSAVLFILLGTFHAGGKAAHFPLHFMLLAWPSVLYMVAFFIAGAWSPPWERFPQEPETGVLHRLADLLFLLTLLPYLFCMIPGFVWAFRYGREEGGFVFYFFSGCLYGLRLYLTYAWPAMTFQQLYIWFRGPAALPNVWIFRQYLQEEDDLPKGLRYQQPRQPQAPVDLQDLVPPAPTSAPPSLDLDEILDAHEVSDAKSAGEVSRSSREE